MQSGKFVCLYNVMVTYRIFSKIFSCLLLFMFLIAGGCSYTAPDRDIGGKPISSLPKGVTLPPVCQNIAMQMVDAVNRARSQGRFCGTRYYSSTGRVSWNRRLEKAALNHSIEMASMRRLSHKGIDGESLRRRIERTGYLPRIWAENVAYGQKNVDEVVNAWLKSPGHCKNIMTKGIRQIGGACFHGRDPEGYDTLYWTLIMAVPR